MAYHSFKDIETPGPKRDFVGYGRKVPRVRWPRDARLSINVVLNYEEGSEYSHPAGDKRSDGLQEVIYAMDPKYRDLAVESVFEYGSRAGVWRLERLVTEFKIPITFYACAVALERNPEVAAWLKEAQHEPCSHGWRWEEVWRLSREEEAEHIRRAIESFTATCGERPQGWYCRYGPSVHTRELLVEEGGFVYDSDAYNDDLPYWVLVSGKPHLVIPYTLDNNDMKFGMPQGFNTGDDFFTYLRDAFDVLYAEGATAPKMMSVGLHMRLAGRPGRFAALRRFLDHVQRHRDVWICRRIDIAHHWLRHHPFRTSP